MNAIAMIVRCTLHQQRDPDYAVAMSHGIEAPDTRPEFAAPSDTGVEGHATFHLDGDGPQMATVTG